MKERSSRLQGRFTGDPSYVYEHTYTHRVGEGEGAQEKVTKVSYSQVMHHGGRAGVTLAMNRQSNSRQLVI